MIMSIKEWLSRLAPIYLYLLLFCAGGLSVLGHAPFFYWPCFGLGIIALIIALDNAKNNGSSKFSFFLRAFSFGLGYFSCGMFWVGAAFLVDAEKFAWLMPFAVVGLSAFLASYWGIAGLLYGIFANYSPFRVFWFASIFSLMEFARGHLFTGLPWNLPAYIWEAGSSISQSGALIGPYGVSLFTLLVFASFASLVHNATKTTRLIALFGILVSLFGLGYGFFRLEAAKNLEVNRDAPVIAVGQAGFAQRELWQAGNEVKIANTYFNLLNTKAAKTADFVVFPEGAFPFLPLEEPAFLNELNNHIGQKTVAFGIIRSEPVNSAEYRYFNSIAFLKQGNQLPELTGLYDKYHLVPFGEYLPFKAFFNALGITSLVAVGEDFSKPTGPKTLKIEDLPRFDPRICYEIIFPGFQKKSNVRADFILNVSVDAWYGDLLGPDQHYNQARWRAIESGQPLVRAASGGWSSITDSFGRAQVELRIGNVMASAKLPATIVAPPYYNHGEVAFLIFSAFFAFLGIVLATKLKV